LPQVATENKWDRETFIRHTCTKAGLPENAWQESDAEIYIFSADIFSIMSPLSPSRHRRLRCVLHLAHYHQVPVA